MLKYTLLLLSSIYALNALEINLVNNPATLGVGDILEWHIAIDEGENNKDLQPQFDVQYTPYLVITDEQGEKHTRRAFLTSSHLPSKDPEGSGLKGDGALYYAIRHSSMRPGTHSWQAYLANNNLVGQGTFIIQKGTPGNKENRGQHGFLRLSTVNPRLLAFGNASGADKDKDEEIFIPIGVNIAWGTPPFRLKKQLQYIRNFALHGGNHIRLWMCSWSAGIESDTADQYRLEHAGLLDRILQCCRKHHVYATLVLDNHHDLVHGKSFPYGSNTVERLTQFLKTPLNRQYKRRLRYIMARYGCDRFIMNWELFNELDEALFDHAPPVEMGTIHQICVKWVSAAATYIKSIDQDHHLISSSLSWSSWDDVMAADGLDLIQVHSYIPKFDQLHQLQKDGILPLQAQVAHLSELRRPFCFSELGYHGSNESNDGNSADPHGVLLRQQMWAGLLLGGYGSGMSWWWDNYIDSNKLWPLYQPLATVCAEIDWNDPLFAPLTVNHASSLRVSGWQSPTQALIWPQLRDNNWHRLLIENQPPKNFGHQHLAITSLQASSSFRIQWFSQISGKIIADSISHSDENGRLVLPCPSGQRECVAVIRAK